jgi:putative transposase
MAKREHYFTRFECGKFYHVYNRSVDRQPMFRSDENCEYFLKKFNQYLHDVLDVYTYSLLDNHFHFLVRIKDNLDKLKSNKKIENDIHLIVSKQFRILFQSYTLAFNKQYNRVGTLFQTPFKRALVSDDGYLTQLILYIHSNPQKHKLIKDFRDWKWSSFPIIRSQKSDGLITDEVIKWFGNLDEFILFHDLQLPSLTGNLIIE